MTFRLTNDLKNLIAWLYRVKEQLVFMDKGQRAATQHGILLAIIPPAFVLALGSALVWALKCFR